MTRPALMAIAVLLLLPVLVQAQVVPNLNEIRQRDFISQGDRDTIRRFVEELVRKMLTDTSEDRSGMIAGRQRLLSEALRAGVSTQAFRQAFAEVTLEVLKENTKKAVSLAARVNFLMVAAQLGLLDAAPLLRSSLENDPYPASQYWAARGLALLAPKIVESVAPRLEAEIADSIKKVLKPQTSPFVLAQLFDALGRFDHEQAHDVLADGAVFLVKTTNAAEPVIARLQSDVIKSVERAYEHEVRPEAKQGLLFALVTMCAWLEPAEDDPRLTTELNATLMKLTGADAGYSPRDPPRLQKLALMEWIERLIRDKRITKRPDLPPAIEEAVKREVAPGKAAGA
ncbi:MAG: hypothetical protein ISS74_04500 [Planctomycetes bacterium]|nr:hypothetical protein [Planctomycetota bacterium]